MTLTVVLMIMRRKNYHLLNSPLVNILRAVRRVTAVAILWLCLISGTCNNDDISGDHIGLQHWCQVTVLMSPGHNTN